MISEKGKKLLADNIKRYRKERGLTQEQLGGMVGLSGVAIMRYEKAQREAKLEIIESIATALEVTGADLIGFEYFDLKNPDLAKEIAASEGMKNYLESLGYIVKENPCDVNSEEGATSCEYEISGNGISPFVTLTSSEYQQLQSSSGDLIYSFLWKKQQK